VKCPPISPSMLFVKVTITPQTVGPFQPLSAGYVTPAMLKLRPITYSWAVYVNGTPARFVGIIDNVPDEQTAIAPAIMDYDATK